jgi:Flp pilus assembly pilin Flp
LDRKFLFCSDATCFGGNKIALVKYCTFLYRDSQAEKKGATATEYGLVFGVFELVVFLISPIYGQHVSTILFGDCNYNYAAYKLTPMSDFIAFEITVLISIHKAATNP